MTRRLKKRGLLGEVSACPLCYLECIRVVSQLEDALRKLDPGEDPGPTDTQLTREAFQRFTRVLNLLKPCDDRNSEPSEIELTRFPTTGLISWA